MSNIDQRSSSFTSRFIHLNTQWEDFHRRFQQLYHFISVDHQSSRESSTPLSTIDRKASEKPLHQSHSRVEELFLPPLMIHPSRADEEEEQQQQQKQRKKSSLSMNEKSIESIGMSLDSTIDER